MSGRGSQMRGSVKPKIVPAPVNLPSLKKESTQTTDPSAHSNGSVWGQKPRTTQPAAPVAAPAPVAISPPAALPPSVAETPSSSESSSGSAKGTYAEISAKHKEKAQKAAQVQAQAQKPEASPFSSNSFSTQTSRPSSSSNPAPSSSQQSSRTTPSPASSSPFSSGPSKIGWDDLNFDGEMDFSKPLVFGDQAESATPGKTSDDRDPFSHDDRPSRSSSSKRRDEYDSDEDKIDLDDDAPRARRFPSGGEDSHLRTKVSDQDVRSSRPQGFSENSRSRPFGRDSDYHSGSSQQRPSSGRSSNWADDDEDDFDHNRRPDHFDSDRPPYDRRQPHSSFASNGSDGSQSRRASRNGPTTGGPFQRRDQNESSFREGSGPYASRDPAPFRYQGETPSSRGGASHRGHREGPGRQEERHTSSYSERASLPKAAPSSSTPAPRPAPVVSSPPSTTAAPAPVKFSSRSWAEEDDFDPAPAPAKTSTPVPTSAPVATQTRTPVSAPSAPKAVADPVVHQEKPAPVKEVANELDPEELKTMKQTMLELANKRRLEREKEQKEKEEQERRRIAERLEKFNQLHPLPPPVQQPEPAATAPSASVPVAGEVVAPKASSDHPAAGSQTSKGYKVIQRETKAGSDVPVDQQSGSATSTSNATPGNLKRKIKVVWIAKKHRYSADGQAASDSANLPQKPAHRNDSQPRQPKQQGSTPSSSSSEAASVVTEKPSDGKWVRSKVIARSIKVEWLVPKPSRPRLQTQIRPPAKTSTSSSDLAQDPEAQSKANGKARDPSKSMVIDAINKHLEPSSPAHQATETVIPTKLGNIVVSLPASSVADDDEGEFTPVSSGRKKKVASEKVKDQQRPKDSGDLKSKTSKNPTQKKPTSSAPVPSSAGSTLPVQTQPETKNLANGQPKSSTPAWTSPSDSIKAVQVALEDPAKSEYSDEVQVIDVDPDSPPVKPRRGRNNSHLKQQNTIGPSSSSTKSQGPIDPQEPATLQELRDTSEPNWSNGQKPAGASPSSSPSLSFQEPNAIGSHLKPSSIASPDLGPSPSPSAAPPSLYSLGPSTADSPSASDPQLIDPKTSETSTAQTTAPSSSDPKIETSPNDDLSKAGTTAPIGSAVGHTGSSDKAPSPKTRSSEMSQHHHQQQQQQQMFGYPPSSEEMFARGHQQHQQQHQQPLAMQWGRQGAIPQPVTYAGAWPRMSNYYYMVPVASADSDPSAEDNAQMQMWSHRQMAPRPSPSFGYVAPSPIAPTYLDGRSYPASYYLPTQSYDVYSEDQYAHQGYPQQYYDYYDKQQQQQQQYLPHLQQQHYQMQLQQQQQQQHYQMQMQQQQQQQQHHQQQMGYQGQRSDSRYNKSQTGSSRGSSPSSSSYPRSAPGGGHHAHGNNNYQSGHHHQQQQHQANRSHRPLPSKAVSEISPSFASDLNPSFAAPPNVSDSLPPAASAPSSSLPENDSNPESNF